MNKSSLYTFRNSRRRGSVKKIFLEISQSSQENTCARVSVLIKFLFFNKVAGLRPVTLLKKSLWHRFFPVNFAKFLRTPFLQNTSGGCFWYATKSVKEKANALNDLKKYMWSKEFAKKYGFPKNLGEK